MSIVELSSNEISAISGGVSLGGWVGAFLGIAVGIHVGVSKTVDEIYDKFISQAQQGGNSGIAVDGIFFGQFDNVGIFTRMIYIEKVIMWAIGCGVLGLIVGSFGTGILLNCLNKK